MQVLPLADLTSVFFSPDPPSPGTGTPALVTIHCGKADVRTIGYLQPNMAGTSNDQIL